MEVPYGEGVAIHMGPEPCAGVREDVGEASAGESIGQPLNRERLIIPDADTVPNVEGNTDGAPSRAPDGPAWSQDPGMCRRFLFGNREISRSAKVQRAVLVRIGKATSRSR